MHKNRTIIRFLFTVVSWLPVPLVLQVTGPRATTVNMIRIIYYLSLKRVNNGKCMTAFRGSLGYTCLNHLLPGLFHIFCLQRFSSISESTV